jgi:hypothetical protein
MTLETIAPLSHDPIVSLPAAAGRPAAPALPVKADAGNQLHRTSGHGPPQRIRLAVQRFFHNA